MADTPQGPLGNSNANAGPPIDLGNATAVVIEKANLNTPAAPTPPVEPPKAGDPPLIPAKTAAEPPAPKVGDPPPTPRPAAKPQATPPKTAAEPSADDPPKPPETPADWPENWRTLMAGKDAKALKALERYNSPIDVGNALRALQQRLSAGELRKALPAHYTEEELKEYRKSNGIPDKPEDYDVNLGNGFVWGETDKPVLDSFRQAALESNIPQDHVKSMLGWYVAQQQQMAEEIAQRDELGRINGADALRAEWGPEYKKNQTAMRNYFEGDAPEMFDIIMSARTQDGRLVGNMPEALKFFAAKSKSENPYATIVPEDGSTPLKSATGRYQELTRMSADKSGPYWRGNTANAMQAEMRGLIEALQKAGQMDDNGRLKAA